MTVQTTQTTNRVVSQGDAHFVSCTKLAYQTETVSDKSLSSYTGGGMVVQVPDVHPILGGTWKLTMSRGDILFTIGATLVGIYGDEVKAGINATANEIGNAVDSLSDSVSQYWDSGSNTNLSFGNGYY